MAVPTEIPAGTRTTTPPTEFIRGIGPLAAISLVVGSMIGSGIFIVPADIGRQVAPWGPGALLLVWVITGAMTVTGALAYAELAAMMPRAGGQYVFLREGLSPVAGFLYGWTLFAVIQTGTIAAVAVAFAKFLSVLVPAVSPDVFLPLGHLRLPGAADAIQLGLSPQRVVAILMIAVLTGTNMLGVTLGAAIQTVFSVVKFGALAALVLLGLTLFRQPDIAAANFSDLWGTVDWSLAVVPAIGAAMVGSLFSSDAWNSVTFAAAEVKNPSRNLPLALMLGTGLVSLLYICANFSYLSVLPYAGTAEGATVVARGISHATQDRVGTAVAETIFGPSGALLMAVAILISTFGCNNGLILSGARVYYAMARDGLFFRRAGTLNSHNVPAFALVVQLIWTAILCLTGTYGQLLNYVIFAALLFYAFTTAGLFILRGKRPDAERPYRAVGYPVLPALYIVLCCAVMLLLLLSPTTRTESISGLVLVLIGIPVFLLWRRVEGPTAAGA
jgi:basic amino acid/polyamine antiporter, APA family